MADRPGYIKNPPKPKTINDSAFDVADDIMAALPVLLRDERFPKTKIEWMKFTPGTDGGMSILYSNAGQQHNRHVTPEEMDGPEPTPEEDADVADIQPLGVVDNEPVAEETTEAPEQPATTE